jgi:hypothetical protein
MGTFLLTINDQNTELYAVRARKQNKLARMPAYSGEGGYATLFSASVLRKFCNAFCLAFYALADTMGAIAGLNCSFLRL